MYDYYEPVPDLACPVCNERLREWQGKSGANALLVWRQGLEHPVRQVADEPWSPEDLARKDWRLPGEFEIYAYDDHDHRVLARCLSKDGIWSQTKIVEVAETLSRRDRVLWPPRSGR